MRTAKTEIVKYLFEANEPLPVHRINIEGYSQNNIATRLSELAKDGIVKGSFPGGVPYKTWSLNPDWLKNNQAIPDCNRPVTPQTPPAIERKHGDGYPNMADRSNSDCGPLSQNP